jgi:hypothetical protein
MKKKKGIAERRAEQVSMYAVAFAQFEMSEGEQKKRWQGIALQGEEDLRELGIPVDSLIPAIKPVL